MSSDSYPFPVAISRLTEGEKSREPQNMRAIEWLLKQAGGALVVVTPQKRFSGDTLKQLVGQSGVTHSAWRGFSAGALAGRRVLYAWPDRKRLNELWGCNADAIVVLEWSEGETAEWVEDSVPTELLGGRTTIHTAKEGNALNEPLPNGVEEILKHVAQMAAGYSSGLKWNEEDMLKADMMNRPERWEPIFPEQIRAKCRELGMRPNDVDTVTGFLQRRKDGRRFNVRSSYRDFRFN